MDLGIRKALAAAEEDGSMHDFRCELSSCGGRFVAEMLEGSLEAARVGGEVGGERGVGRRRSSPRSEAARAAAAAAHERLHSGPWHAVPHCWRDAYTLACLLQADDVTSEAEKGGAEKEEEEAMRLIDASLLLGGTRFRRAAHAAAEALSPPPSSSADAALASSFPESWPPPRSPVRLPPGSMGGSRRGTRVEALSAAPSLDEFISRARGCLASGPSSPHPPLPFVIPRSAPSFAASWPALGRWASPRYWDAVAGNRTVPVEVGESYLSEGWSQRLQTLRRFLEEHVLSGASSSPQQTSAEEGQERKKEQEEKEEEQEKEKRETDGGGAPLGYLAQHDLLEQVRSLSRDVLVPDYALALCGTGDDGGGDEGEHSDVVPRNLWLGPAGTFSPLHTDPKRNLFCQVVGRKYVRLYGPECGEALLQGGGSGDPTGGDGETLAAALTSSNTSRVDVFSSASDSPLSSLSFFDAILGPGDVLFIPRGWWHLVLSLETSASVSFWF